MTRKSDISVISRLQRYARLLLPCILCAAVAAGCADRSDDIPSVPAAGFRAGFYITTAATNSPSLSRAPQPGTYEPGTADENYIDIDGKDFAIYFFDSSDAYVGSLTNVLSPPPTATAATRPTTSAAPSPTPMSPRSAAASRW